MTEQPDESQPLQDLKAAIQAFASSGSKDAVLVDVAVVMWEQVGFTEDGEPHRHIDYAVPTDNFSLSGTLGLLEAGGVYIRRDILAHTEDDL